MRTNFIVAGPPKSGTSRMYALLKQHPDICLSKEKEPYVFLRDTEFNERNFRRYFPNYRGEQMVGEATSGYFVNVQAASKLVERIPDLKFIFVLRDPVKRAHEHYQERKRCGREKRSWYKAIHDRVSDYLIDFSFYYENLVTYLQYFPQENIHVVFYEELLADQENVLKGVFDFLGVDDTFMPEAVTRQYHTARGAITRNILGMRLGKKKTGGTTVVSRGIASLEKLKNVLAMVPVIGDYMLNDRDERYLRNVFSEDQHNLEELLGRPVPWGHLAS